MRTLPIRTRLTLFYSTLLFAALMIFATAAVGLLRVRLTARIEASLDRKIQGLEAFLRRETTREKAAFIPEEVVEYAFTQPEGHLIEVTDAAGGTILRSDVVTQPALTRESTFTLYGQAYHVRAAASLEPVEESARELRQLLLWSAPLLLLLLAVTGYWIGRRALAPVDEMTRAARSIGVRNLGQRLQVPPGRDELSRLAVAWNDMLKRLEDSVSRMRQFTADAAHELRTPLTALRTTAELSLRRPRTSAEYRESLQQIVAIAERMTGLADVLLTLARADETAAQHRSEVVDLSGIVKRVASEMEPVFALKGHQVYLDLPVEPATLLADSDAISRLVASLLDNATKYTPSGGRIDVSIQDNSTSWEMRVADSGQGIPAESIARIFDRFYRVDESRSHQTGGYGLGLAIAQQIASVHNGSIDVAESSGEGACFRVRFEKTAVG